MAVDEERMQAELARMKQLIADDPEVLARFDADGNGVIDGQEWEAVRQVVRRRLEREQAEAELARQLREQLDPEQAAELARMEAAMAEEEAQGAAESPAQPPNSPMKRSSVEDRDWGDLELAFDPTQDAATRHGSIAEELYERELSSHAAAMARQVRASEHGTLADRRVLVLEQAGGVRQLFGNMFRRTYQVLDAHGDPIGRIGQRQNEMAQDLTRLTILNDPDLSFVVEDDVAGERFEMRRSSGLTENSISVYNPRSIELARTEWSLSFVRRRYEVRAVREGMSYWAKRRLTRPWTYDLLDPFERPLGRMMRGWSGLGFLTAGNLFRIELDRDVDPDIMWGFLSCALLADLDSESNSRKSAFDLFNG